MPHRVLRSELVDELESDGVVRRLAGRSATRWPSRRCPARPGAQIVREGMAMRRSQELTWAQVLMAANTPMLLRAGDGRRAAPTWA